MSGLYKILILLFISTNAFSQVDKGDLLYFLKGDFNTTTSKSTEHRGPEFLDTYKDYDHEVFFSGETGVKFSFLKNMVAGFSIEVNNTKTVSRKESINKTFIKYNPDNSSNYLINNNKLKETITERNYILKPGISYYVNITPRTTLLINTELLIKRSNGALKVYRSNNFGEQTSNFESGKIWSFGLQFNPALLTNVYKRFYLYYAPFNIYYLRDFGYSNEVEQNNFKVSTNLNLISIGVFYKLHGTDI